MPIGYRGDRSLGCTIAVWDGDLTGEDMHDQLFRLASDPEWPPGPRHLVDATTLGRVILPDLELVELLYEGTNLVNKTRIAFVVSADFFAADRPLFQRATYEFDAATFADLDRACEYLDLDITAVRSIIHSLRHQLGASL
jgi:hypothetical protein